MVVEVTPEWYCEVDKAVVPTAVVVDDGSVGGRTPVGLEKCVAAEVAAAAAAAAAAWLCCCR